MDEPKRRARRAQLVQLEQEAIRQQNGPDDSLEASPEQAERTPPVLSASGSAVHRRRAAQQDLAPDEAEQTAEHAPVRNAAMPEYGKHIPQLPRIEDDAQVRFPQTGAKKKQTRKKISAPRTLDAGRLRRAASISAKAGKKAIEGLGGLLLLVLMTASEGFGKLWIAVKKWTGNSRSDGKKNAEKHSAAEQKAYELELILPKDYHGRGQEHARKTSAPARVLPKRTAGKPASNAQMLNRALSALLVCVALFSAWQIGSIVLRSIRTNRLNDALSRERAAMIEAQEMQQPEQENGAEPDTTLIDQPAAMPVQTQEPAAVYVQSVPTSAPDVVKTTRYRHMGGDALPEMAALYEKNRDLVAWIQIPDVLDLPVVYRNNDYYLTRDFNKQKNASGTIFLDVNHPFKEKTQNLLLHGHNMKDGTMFGRLAQYLYDDTYIRNHPFIYFDTLWDKEQYVIFAILNVSLDTKNERFFNYFTHDTFSSDAEFQSYIRQLQLRSYYAIPIDVQPGDALLTLSTCLEDDRLVIVARRLRENETRSDLRTLIRMTTRQ